MGAVPAPTRPARRRPRGRAASGEASAARRWAAVRPVTPRRSQARHPAAEGGRDVGERGEVQLGATVRRPAGHRAARHAAARGAADARGVRGAGGGPRPAGATPAGSRTGRRCVGPSRCAAGAARRRAAGRRRRRARRRPPGAASAVRASASATPPASTSSSSGRTSWRRRTRVKRGSALCGSSHTGRPSPAQAARVVAPADGQQRAQPRRVPAGACPRASGRRSPRPRPSSTVSAWSSRVWPSRIGLSGCGRAAHSAAWRARRAAASIPPGPVTSTGVHPRRDPALGEQRDGGRRAFGRPVLQPVVDDHGLHVVRAADGRGGER